MSKTPNEWLGSSEYVGLTITLNDRYYNENIFNTPMSEHYFLNVFITVCNVTWSFSKL